MISFFIYFFVKLLVQLFNCLAPVTSSQLELEMLLEDKKKKIRCLFLSFVLPDNMEFAFYLEQNLPRGFCGLEMSEET